MFTPPKPFYSRKQGNTTFNFYCQHNHLIAKIIKNDGSIEALQINNLPEEFLNLDENKINKLKIWFDSCYFKIQGGILVNARGVGGWNDDIHHGSKFNGTAKWTNDILNLEERKKISQACRNVDYGKLGPTKNQSYHFNTNFKQWCDYSRGDSRNVLAAKYMIKAINEYFTYIENEKNIKTLEQEIIKKKQKIKEEIAYLQMMQALQASELHHFYYYSLYSLREETYFLEQDLNKLLRSNTVLYNTCFRELGIGLHPLQDMYAHTKDFVYRARNNLFFGWQFHLNNGADDPNVQPERYLNTEIATKLYLNIFLYNIGFDIDDEKFLNQAISDHIKQSGEKFLGFIEALKAESNNTIKFPIQISFLFEEMLFKHVNSCYNFN